MDVLELTKKLISISSLSGQENLVCDFVFNLLKDLEFNPQKILVDKNGFNILVKVGNPKVSLAGHLDTVPPFLKVKETKDKLFGRGTCDMKGAIAAMIIAAKQAKDKGLKNFGLAFTVGEETDFRGVNKLVNFRPELGFIVLGEPTNLQVVNGHFGVLELQLIAKGKKAHSSQPEKGINAIDKLLVAIEQVIKLKIFPESSLNLGTIKGGTAVNIVPDEAIAGISFRISPEDKNDYFKQITDLVGKQVKVEKGLCMASVKCEIPTQFNFLKTKGVVRYMTELSVLKNGVVLGPGDIGFAHQDNEFVLKRELQKAVEVYLRVLGNYCQRVG